QQNSAAVRAKAIQILDFDPTYIDHFRKLNEAWIRKYFFLEQADRAILSNPEKIIADGGAIFFARLAEKITGTAALVKVEESTFEIAKMAVAEDYQGMGIGRMLLDACIERAKASNATCVTLETNTILTSAVQLYKKAGFKSVPLEDSHQ